MTNYRWQLTRKQTKFVERNLRNLANMTSEGILHLVPHVKLKKNEGELYLMTERLGWMVGNKDSFSVSHKYSDIKSKLML